MSEEKLEIFIRNFIKTFEEMDVEKILSFFADDAVYVSVEGAFESKEELRRYFNWSIKINPNVKVRDTGVGLVVKGNKVFHEFIVDSVNPKGVPFEIHGLDVYEVSNDKIQRKRSYYDRLSIAKQVTQGWVGKRVISTIVNGMEKGLHQS